MFFVAVMDAIELSSMIALYGIAYVLGGILCLVL